MLARLEERERQSDRRGGGQNAQGKRRRKRKLTDFVKSPLTKWTFPIPYKFDGRHSELNVTSFTFYVFLSFSPITLTAVYSRVS